MKMPKRKNTFDNLSSNTKSEIDTVRNSKNSNRSRKSFSRLINGERDKNKELFELLKSKDLIYRLKAAKKNEKSGRPWLLVQQSKIIIPEVQNTEGRIDLGVFVSNSVHELPAWTVLPFSGRCHKDVPDSDCDQYKCVVDAGKKGWLWGHREYKPKSGQGWANWINQPESKKYFDDNYNKRYAVHVCKRQVITEPNCYLVIPGPNSNLPPYVITNQVLFRGMELYVSYHATKTAAEIAEMIAKSS